METPLHKLIEQCKQFDADKSFGHDALIDCLKDFADSASDDDLEKLAKMLAK